MVWPTIGLRTAKEQNRAELQQTDTHGELGGVSRSTNLGPTTRDNYYAVCAANSTKRDGCRVICRPRTDAEVKRRVSVEALEPGITMIKAQQYNVSTTISTATEAAMQLTEGWSD